MSDVGRIFSGHDPGYGAVGTDVLVTIWPDGGMEVALRPGRDMTWLRWGPPYPLTDASVMHEVRDD